MWLWYVDVPGQSPVPVGVYDHAHDPAVPGLRSINIGHGGVARVLKGITSIVKDLDRLLEQIPGPLP